MEDAESVAEWGERWLRDWCDEPGLKQDERETRAWLAEGWRNWTLDTVMSREGWFHPTRVLLEQANLNRIAANEVALYRGTLHALPVWRLFHHYRSEGLQVPEFVLAMFDEWAGRLMKLQHDAAADRLPAAEGPAILRALQFAGDRKGYASLKRLSSLERRRRMASEIWSLRRLYRTPWKTIAERFNMPEHTAKSLVYEFEPGPRRRKRGTSAAADLAAAHRRMARK